MFRPLPCILFVATFLITFSLPAKGPETGFVELYNGKDLTGWGYYSNPKGNINPNSKDRGEFVSFAGKTEASDGRYSAKGDTIVVNAGKGIQVLWTEKLFPKNMEIRFEFRAAVNADSGFFIRNKQLQVRDYLVAGPYKLLQKYKPQDWNEVVVIVKGQNAMGACNGETLDAGIELSTTGALGLEADRAQMEFRKIRVKDMN